MIDGGGTLVFSPSRESWTPTLRICNTNREIIGQIRQLLGPLPVRIRDPTPRRKTVYDVSCTSSVLRWVLPQLRLIAKERQRVLLLEALDILATRRGSSQYWIGDGGTGRLREIYQEIRRLNKKGPL